MKSAPTHTGYDDGMETLTNRLTETTSTYLQQHRDNPVHWQPWDARALALAKELDKPILLSIGYAACHWCHVMAHECFEDPAIAGLMNRLYINIKVDRQERPDLDSQYQLAHQLFTGRGGGWPLTVFLDPQDLTPFFAGTYFPPLPSRGMPGFTDVMQKLSSLFEQRREDLQEQALRLREALNQLQSGSPARDGRTLSDAPVHTARQRLLDGMDEQFGGIGSAPKFPRCPELNLLAVLARGGDAECTQALRLSLQAMLDGGLYDHLGGGFYRYCVDGHWTIPHFEKMLYDNAQLLPLLADHADELNNARRAIDDSIAWLERRMALPAGDGELFAAALDADSQDASGKSEEGAYYLWRTDQVKNLLPQEDYSAFATHYGLDQPANFEGHAWHLRCRPGQMPDPELDESRRILLHARQQRPLPTLDNQALCGWNALLAHGLLSTGYRLQDQPIIERGQRLVDTLWQCLWINDGEPVLHQRFAAGAAHGQAFLEDAAALLLAMLTSLRINCHPQQLERCQQLGDYLLTHFYNPEHGGFWLSPADHADDLLVRSKPFLDDATPAGNALACLALLRLGHLCGEPRYLDAVEATLHSALDDIERYPGAAGGMLVALEEWLQPRPQVLARMTSDDAERAAWLARTDADIYFVGDGSEWLEQPDSLIGGFCRQTREQDQAVMVCLGNRCLPPCDGLPEAEKLWQRES